MPRALTPRQCLLGRDLRDGRALGGHERGGPVATRRCAADWRKDPAPSSVATSAWTAPDSMSWRSSSFAPFHRSSAGTCGRPRWIATPRKRGADTRTKPFLFSVSFRWSADLRWGGDKPRRVRRLAPGCCGWRIEQRILFFWAGISADAVPVPAVFGCSLIWNTCCCDLIDYCVRVFHLRATAGRGAQVIGQCDNSLA